MTLFLIRNLYADNIGKSMTPVKVTWWELNWTKKHCLFSLLINICCSHLYYYVESSTERADAPGLGLEPKSLNSAYTKHKKFLSKLRLWVVSTFYHGIIRLCITWTSNFCKSWFWWQCVISCFITFKNNSKKVSWI